MEHFLQLFQEQLDENPGIFFLSGFLFLIWMVGNARLYAKCDQPWYAAFIPVYNVIVAMKIIGRPSNHIFLFLIPGYNVYLVGKTLIELCQSFGKFSLLDYVMALVFNVFYVLNLGLAYNEEYHGPVYGISKQEIQSREAQFA